MRAKYPGVCKACKKPFPVSTSLLKDGPRSYRHAHCDVAQTASWWIANRRTKLVSDTQLARAVFRSLMSEDPTWEQWLREHGTGRPGVDIARTTAVDLFTEFDRYHAHSKQRWRDPTPPAPTPDPPITGDPADPKTDAQLLAELLERIASGGAALDALKERLDALEQQPIGLSKDELAAAVQEALDKTDNRVIDINVKPVALDPVALDLQHPAMEKVLHAMRAGIRAYIWGPAGWGKTTACRMAAHAMGYAHTYIQLPSITKFDVLGYLDAGSNVIDTPTSLWCKDTRDALLIYDELDSWQQPAQTAANLPLANDIAVLPGSTEAVDITRGGSCRKLALGTGNTDGKGATSSYGARYKLDDALQRRFEATVHWGVCEDFERRLAVSKFGDDSAVKNIVEASQRIRRHLSDKGVQHNVAPTHTFAACAMVQQGTEAAMALRLTVCGQLDDAVARDAILSANIGVA